MLAKSRDTGKTFNDALRSHRDFKNPILLSKLIENWGVEQYGSAFPKEIFDPELHAEDKIESIMLQLAQEQDERRKAREKLGLEQLRRGAGIQFERGCGDLGILH